MLPSSLSPKTQSAILIEAEQFDDILLDQFTLLCKYCESENDFIAEALKLAKGMLHYDEDEMDELFLGEPPSIEEFHEVLGRIVGNIEGGKS